MRGLRLRSVFLGLYLAALAIEGGLGCASTPKPRTYLAEPPPDRALVYFCRTQSKKSTFWVLEGETLLAVLDRKAYAPVYLEAGRHWIWTWKTSSPPSEYQRGVFVFEAGHAYGVFVLSDGGMALMGLGILANWMNHLEGFELQAVTPELQETARAEVRGRTAARAIPELPPDLPRQPSAGHALVYLASSQSWASPRCLLEGEEPIAFLRGSGYAAAEFLPGLHRLWSPGRLIAAAAFVFEAGRSYTVLVDTVGFMTLMPTAASLAELSPNPRFGPSAMTADEFAKASQFARDHPSVAGPSEKPCVSPTLAEDELLLPAGSPVRLRLTENATSFNTPAGETLQCEIDEDVRVGETVVVPKGLRGEVLVTEARPGARGYRPGLLGVATRGLEVPGGRTISLLGLVSPLGAPTPEQEFVDRGEGPGGGSYVSEADLLIFGLLALFGAVGSTIRSDDTWLRAGWIVTAQVRCDTAVARASVRRPETPRPGPVGPPLTATSVAPIVVPAKGRVDGRWCVRLETADPPREVWIASVGGRSPPQHVGPLRITSRAHGQEVCFPAWAVVRFVTLEPSALVTIPVLLEGSQADGSPFSAEVSVSVEFGKH